MNIWRISCHGQSFPEANAADELSFNCIYSGRCPLGTVFLSAYEISLYSQIDLSMKNKNKILVDPLGLDDEAVSINDVKYVDFVSNDGNVKTFTLNHTY
jgi:hypothetical protein